jgi:hypothetical protein
MGRISEDERRDNFIKFALGIIAGATNKVAKNDRRNIMSPASHYAMREG